MKNKTPLRFTKAFALLATGSFLALLSTLQAEDEPSKTPLPNLSAEMRKRYGLLVSPGQFTRNDAPVDSQSEKRFDLKVPSVPVEQFVKRIQDVSHQPINVVIAEKDRGVLMPALELQNVTLRDVFAAISALSERAGEITLIDPSSGIPSATPRHSFERINDSGIWIFRVNESKLDRNTPNPQPEKKEPSYVMFFPLQSHLEAMGIDDVVTAINTGFELVETKPAKLKFHKETQLLIAAGKEDQLLIIQNALKALEARPKIQSIRGSNGLGGGGSIPSSSNPLPQPPPIPKF